jgi:hypothetical protein
MSMRPILACLVACLIALEVVSPHLAAGSLGGGAARRRLSFLASPQVQPKAEGPAATIGGTWTATAGPKRTFRGTWSARSGPATPNTAVGSWTLLGASNRPMLEGTWSAQKTDAGWQGTWAARVTMGRLRSGRMFSGTWQAALPGFAGRTLTEMLWRSVEAQVLGSWRTQGLSGTWSLRASPSSSGRGSSSGPSSDITR